jgi:hypothetical protein
MLTNAFNVDCGSCVVSSMASALIDIKTVESEDTLETKMECVGQLASWRAGRKLQHVITQIYPFNGPFFSNLQLFNKLLTSSPYPSSIRKASKSFKELE